MLSLWRSGQCPGWPQSCIMARRWPGSSVMMPSTSAPTKAQRSLLSLIVQTMKRMRARGGRVAWTCAGIESTIHATLLLKSPASNTCSMRCKAAPRSCVCLCASICLPKVWRLSAHLNPPATAARAAADTPCAWAYNDNWCEAPWAGRRIEGMAGVANGPGSRQRARHQYSYAGFKFFLTSIPLLLYFLDFSLSPFPL